LTQILGPEIIHRRKHLASLWLFSAITLAFAAASASATPQVVDDGLVIEDVTLISPERSSPVPHFSVVIRSGRIAQIAPGLIAGPHATRLNGRDRFLIPGLTS